MRDLAARPTRVGGKVAGVVAADAGSMPARQTYALEVQPGAAWAPLPGSYRRRDPEATVLHQAVRENLATFLDLSPSTDEEVESLPRTIAGRVVRLLGRLGRLDEDAFPEDSLQALQGASIQRVTALRFPPHLDKEISLSVPFAYQIR